MVYTGDAEERRFVTIAPMTLGVLALALFGFLVYLLPRDAVVALLGWGSITVSLALVALRPEIRRSEHSRIVSSLAFCGGVLLTGESYALGGIPLWVAVAGTTLYPLGLAIYFMMSPR